MKTGGQLIVEALEANGAERLYCVPGESYLAVLDALLDSKVAVTVCRQEGGAAMMADAYGKLTGRPGICFVTRAPGAANAVAGLHIARHDSTPLILFIGQVPLAAREREAFQEVEYRRMMTELAKWVAEIEDPARIPEYVNRAFAVATSGRPGPVVLALPEDVLSARADAAPARPHQPVETHPAAADIEALGRMLAQAARPFMVLGGSRWTEAAVQQITTFAERFELPVACTFRRQMLFDHLHQSYAGDLGIGANPKLAARVKMADLLLLVGGRFPEIPSANYTLMRSPDPEQTLVHVYPAAEELGRVYRPQLAVHASPAAFAAALSGLQPAGALPWAGKAAKVHADYLAWSTPPEEGAGAVKMGRVMAHLEAVLPDDAILTTGAGNFSGWMLRFRRYRRFGTQLGPTSGSMGYGVPAAVAAKQLRPDRLVIAFSGDGDFLMNGQELATAVQYELPIVVILLNNSMYGTIRMRQEVHYPGRVSATTLKNPDFAALARAYGGHGETVRETEEFAPAFERAVGSGKPAIVEILLDPEQIAPTRTLSEIRNAALGAKRGAQ